MKLETLNSMKKIFFPVIAVAILLAVSSCDTKSCKCYVYDGTNAAQRVIEYVDDASPCASLDYSRGTRYRICIENNEPDIDPSQIAQEYKK